MFIEEAVISKTVRARCNNVLFLIYIDTVNISNCKITRISDNTEVVPYVKLITDRALWEAFKELKEYIDNQFKLLPVESDRVIKKRRVMHYKDKPCSKCGKLFSPIGAKSKICSNCT